MPESAKLTFPPQAYGDHLRDEIAAACGIPAPYVDVYADRVEVVGMVDESMRSAIEQVLAAHDPAAQVATDPDQELMDAIQASTNFEQLKAALLGTNLPAMVAARGKGPDA